MPRIVRGRYITEIVRAGIQSIPKGQWEAACQSLSPINVLRDIIFHKQCKILPPLAGQFITLIKDSAIVSLISFEIDLPCNRGGIHNDQGF